MRLGSELLLALRGQRRAARWAEAGVGLDLGAAVRTEAVGHARAFNPSRSGSGSR